MVGLNGQIRWHGLCGGILTDNVFLMFFPSGATFRKDQRWVYQEWLGLGHLVKNGSVLPGSVLIGNFSWESLLEPRISDQLSMSAQKSSLDVMAPRSIGWWFLLTSTTWRMIASAISGDVSKPNFTIFWGNKHPLTSYFRIPSGCQSFDENHHTGSFQNFGHLYRRWGTQPPSFGKKNIFSPSTSDLAAAGTLMRLPDMSIKVVGSARVLSPCT